MDHLVSEIEVKVGFLIHSSMVRRYVVYKKNNILLSISPFMGPICLVVDYKTQI